MATLIINRSDSKCGACGKSTSPWDNSHETILGYIENGQPGCGAVFDSLSSDYMGMDEAVKAMRPDLPFVDPLEFAGIRRKND